MISFNKRKLVAVPRAALACLILLSLGSSVAFAQQSIDPEIATGQLMVSVAPGTSIDAVKRLADSNGCELLSAVPYTPDCYVFAVKDRDQTKVWALPTASVKNALSSLRAQSGIVSASLNSRVQKLQAPTTPNDPMTDRMWGLRMINMPQAWAIQEGSPVKVAVLDTGVDAAHPDFLDSSGATVLAGAADFSGDNLGAAVDPDGHGTHVAGTIGAATNNGVGVPSIAGWQRGGIRTTIVPVRVLTTNGGTLAGVIAGLNYAVLQRVNVINLSLGGASTGPPAPEEVTAINNAIAQGIVVIAGAGNDSTNSEAGQFFYPADIPGVIKVSAVGPTRNLASYSSHGRTPNTQLIAAPGGDITTDPATQGIWSLQPGNQYQSIQGTSMATPHVSGLAALLLAGGAPAREVYPIMARTAQQPPVPNPTFYGPGIIDAYAALLEVIDPAPGVVFPGTQASSATTLAVDRGVSYFAPTSIRVQVSGAANIVGNAATPTGKQVRQSALTVEVYRLGESTPFRTFVGGTDFLVPTPAATDPKNVKFTVDVPSVASNRSARPGDAGVKLPDTPLTPGQSYKIVAKLSGVVQSTQFVTVAEKILTPGRSMFALPFKAGLATGTGPVENQLLGSTASFTLTRYNPLRLPSEDDYARYQSTGSVVDPAARFLVSGTPGGPNTYDISDPSTSIAPIGVGYWLDLATATKIDTARLTDGRTSSTGLDATNAVGIRVTASGGGWNMIGAPFTYPVEWSAVSVLSGGVNYALPDAIANGIISPVLVGYDGARRDYVYSIAPSGTLQPFNAYWVRAFKDAVLIVPPRDSGATRSLKTESKPELGASWLVQFSAAVAGDRDSQNFIGQSANALDGVDKADIPKPPAGAGHAYVRFESKDSASTRALAYDLRSARSTQKQEWVAAVTSARANADVTLSWNGLQSVPKRSKLSLKDLATNQVISMQGRASYTYRAGEAGETRRFALVLEPQATAGSLLISNVRTTGGTRSEGGMSVKFLVNQDAEVTGSVRSLSGKTIATLAGTTRAQAGSDATLRWNGKAQDGSAIPAGPYVLDVVARAADGSTVRVARTIQHLR